MVRPDGDGVTADGATVSHVHSRRTQGDRRAKTRSSLLEAAARGLATYGYANLALEQVARDAGYTRGALYHQFANKEDLALAVVDWVGETWDAEVRQPALARKDPLDLLLTLARLHARYCGRHEGARVILTLRVELSRQDHPVGHAMDATYEQLETECARLIRAGRREGSIPPGPPVRLTARAFLAVLESVGIEVAGTPPHDVELVERAVRGILGVGPGAPSAVT